MSEVVEKYAKLNYSKDTLIHDFLEYLKKGNNNIPLDIINAKIDIIDILYVPFFIYKLSGSMQVEARIGRDHTEWETKKTGRRKIEYEKDFWGNINRYETDEEHVVANNYTIWNNESFSVDAEKEQFTICANTHIAFLLKEDIKYDFDYNDTAEKKENLKELKVNENINKFDKQKEELKKELEQKAESKINSMGDRYKDIKMSEVNFDEKYLYLKIPIGYIKYKYNSDSKNYYFVESLSDKKIFCQTSPEDKKFAKANSRGKGISFITFILYLFLAYITYKLTHIINLPYMNYLFYSIIGILFADWFSIFCCYASNSADNIEKRHKYIANIIEENYTILKDLVNRLDKPYKD